MIKGYRFNPLVQNYAIEVSTYHVNNHKIPLAFDGYRIVMISDLHNARFGKQQQRLIDHIKRQKPNLIVFTGDQIDRRRYDIQPVLELVQGIHAIAPLYFITGNHERKSRYHEESTQILIHAGMTFLDQKSIPIYIQNEYIYLTGIGEYASSNQEVFKSLKAPQSSFQILLCHYPHLLDTYVHHGFDLVLSGHAHGGQWRMGRKQGWFAPDQGLLPKYTKGLFEKEKTTMVVSAGLGNSMFPLRLNNYPNLVTIVLKPSGLE